MLPGFNTNVRHGGVLFHVQTEDSGRTRPHVITHLFHGGTILASEKRSYAEHLDAPDLAQRVRAVMDGLHNAMLGQLRGGELDEQIEQRLGGDVFSAGGTKSKSGSGHTQRARSDSEPEPTIPPGVVRPLAPLTTPVLSPSPASVAMSPGAAEAGAAPQPLDELILDYLFEAARRRKRRAE